MHASYNTVQILNAGFRFIDEHEVLSGDQSGEVAWWDLRNPAAPLRKLTVRLRIHSVRW
jgi:hypothetical protein